MAHSQLKLVKALKHIRSAIGFGSRNEGGILDDGYSHMRTHMIWGDLPKDPKDLPKGFKIKKSGIPKAGNGLFTQKLIKAGEYIGRYKGEKLSDQEAEDQSRKDRSCMFQVHTYDDDQVRKNPHLKRGTKKNRLKFVIDGASPSRCFVSYVNAANTDDKQNAEFQQDGYKIKLYAIHDIHPNQEILAWYGNDTGKGVGTFAMTNTNAMKHKNINKNKDDPNMKLRYTGKRSASAPYISNRASMVHGKTYAQAIEVQYTNSAGKLVQYKRADLQYDINTGYLDTEHE